MKKIFLYILIILPNLIYSQTRINDAGARFSIKLRYKLNEKEYLNLMYRTRILENFSELNSWFIDAGYGYKINNDLKISLHYRFNSSITNNNYFRTLHRYYLRADYRQFINKYWILHNRIILQHTTHRFVTDIQDNGYKPYYRTDLRERIGFSYNLSSSDNIFLHNEWMFTLSDNPVELRRNRLYVGYEKDINDDTNIKCYFILQSSFHKRKNPDTNYFIFGIDINFMIN